MRKFRIKVYTIDNGEYSYVVEAEDFNRPREHAKRIVIEGYWMIDGFAKETIISPHRIVKTTIREES